MCGALSGHFTGESSMTCQRFGHAHGPFEYGWGLPEHSAACNASPWTASVSEEVVIEPGTSDALVQTIGGEKA
eukprot:s619_g33.t1